MWWRGPWVQLFWSRTAADRVTVLPVAGGCLDGAVDCRVWRVRRRKLVALRWTVTSGRVSSARPWVVLPRLRWLRCHPSACHAGAEVRGGCPGEQLRLRMPPTAPSPACCQRTRGIHRGRCSGRCRRALLRSNRCAKWIVSARRWKHRANCESSVSFRLSRSEDECPLFSGQVDGSLPSSGLSSWGSRLTAEGMSSKLDTRAGLLRPHQASMRQGAQLAA